MPGEPQEGYLFACEGPRGLENPEESTLFILPSSSRGEKRWRADPNQNPITYTLASTLWKASLRVSTRPHP